MADTNLQVTLKSRPQGWVRESDFAIVESPVPQPGDGEVLLRALYLSLDPYMRSRMDDAKSYAKNVEIGEVMVGGTVSRVVASRNPKFAEGDLVLGGSGWQDYSLSNGRDLMALGNAAHPSLALSVLGMPGFTAYHGLLNIGEPKPGETVVVAAASGAVGAVVGQIARIKGARVVGVAGGADKCRYVLDELGFDACIDRNDPQFAQKLAQACKDGIDVYFENVGGAVLDAVLPLLNDGARVPVCGLIAHYNDQKLPAGPDRLPLLLGLVLRKRIRLQGYIIMDHYADGFAPFYRDMSGWVAAGKVKLREDIVDGLENAPAAFIGLLEGRNFGKLVVHVAD